VILVVALLVVGPSKLPEVARSIGKALGELRRMTDEVKDTLEHELDAEEAAKEGPTQPGGTGEAADSGGNAKGDAPTAEHKGTPPNNTSGKNDQTSA
jgi:sec-independent protein translocase protein TatB